MLGFQGGVIQLFSVARLYSEGGGLYSTVVAEDPKPWSIQAIGYVISRWP